jgi:small subunit ribosomal protein S6
MFLLDNQVVRQDWSKAKSIVTDLLEKHGATVKSARRWDERRLAYPIKRRNRATFLLTYSEIPSTGIASLRRDLELNEDILRYLFLTTEDVPQEELDLTTAEGSDDFVVPLPPEDHELDVEESAEEKSEEAKGEEMEGGVE